MDIFDFDGKEFDEKLEEIFSKYNKEELKKELINCGLKLDNNDITNSDEYDYTMDIVCNFTIYKETSSFWNKIISNKKEKEVNVA